MFKKYRRAIATLLLITFITDIFSPTVSWALTAGPTAPEATSFEPVDTTDMVNLSTGDLVYNLPLLEVPGPSGGYPLSLSYHAGILPGEESSWCGLGWNISTGAITRSVSGFADDQFNVNNAAHFFWEGGERKTLKVGVTAGITGVLGVSANLSFSQDTYQGFGIGNSLEASLGKGVALNGTVGTDPFNGTYSSVGIGLSQRFNGLNMGLDISTSDFKSVNFDLSAGRGRTNMLGVSISTDKGGTSVNGSVGGASINNSKIGNISTSGYSLTLPLPFVSLGYRYQRYWADEIENVQINGTLYNPTSSVSSGFDNKGFDSYSLLDAEAGIAENPDPSKVLGGSFLNSDQYFVNAQGLGGQIKPYSYKNTIFRQNIKKGESYEIKQYPYSAGYSNDPFEFRFIGDFSNRYINNDGSIESDASYPMIPNFGSSQITGANGNDGIVNNHLAGSRHIEWYTNDQISDLDNSKNPELEGFVDCNASGFTRSNNGSKGKQIGGFKITNESGVTYHFALPVYSYDEYSYSEKIDKSNGLKFNEFKKPEPYAYTWYLTAITGPDFVDRGPSGIADGALNEFDWGYWVEFEYGKWTDMYQWRNPSEGMDIDIDGQFQYFSEGKKELYYLDAIRTKTHTALFVKDIRHDAKSSLPFLRNINKGKTFGMASNPPMLVSSYDIEQITENTKIGGFIPKSERCDCEKKYSETLNPEGIPNDDRRDKGYVDYFSTPTSTLKLDSIILIDNESLNDIALTKTAGVEYEQTSSYEWAVQFNEVVPASVGNCDFSAVTSNHHLYQNVLDIHDIANSSILSKALRVIGLKTDYSLSPECPNSFDYSIIKQQSPPITNDLSYPKQGKLTLRSVHVFGKGGLDFIPPVKFNYELTNPVKGDAKLEITEGNFFFDVGSSGLQKGDLITFVSNSKKCYALITDINNARHSLKIVGEHLPIAGHILFAQTKNPPYNKMLYDIWGFYKSDYSVGNDSYTSRVVTEVSSKSLDVWSLRTVKSSLGAEIKIDYEPDQYKNAIQFKGSLSIESLEPLETQGLVRVTFANQLDINKLNLSVQDQISVVASLKYNGLALSWDKACVCDEEKMMNLFMWKTIDKTAVIEQVEANALVVSSQDIYEQLNRIYNHLSFPDCKGVTVQGQEIDSEYNFGQKGIFVGGNVILDHPLSLFGGGIRVNKLEVRNINNSSELHYSYLDGLTSYEPLNIDESHLEVTDFLYSYNDEAQAKAIKEFNKILYKNFSGLLGISRELPPPGVLYGNVTTRGYHNGVSLPNYSVYQFDTFDEDVVNVAPSQVTEDDASMPFDGITFQKLRQRDVTITSLTSQLGQLRKVTVLNNENQKLSETVNHYLYDEVLGATIDERISDFKAKLENKFQSQGTVHETTIDGRFMKKDDGAFDLLGIVSRKHFYPAIQTGQTSINFKTGVRIESKNIGFDFYSGQVTQTESMDEYGNTYRTEVIPAYKKYPEMGLGINGYKNMLSQEAASYSYKVNSQNNDIVGLVNASIQTWSDHVPVLSEGLQLGIWRKHAGYSFIGDSNNPMTGDGLYPLSNVLPPFDAWNISDLTPVGWQKNGFITLYDVHSHALEAADINQRYATTKMSSDNTKVFSTATNTRYNQFAYSGAEDNVLSGNYGGGVETAQGVEVFKSGETDALTTHTGAKALKLTTPLTQKAFRYAISAEVNKFYHASVWVNSLGGRLLYKVNGVTSAAPVPNDAAKAGSWYLISVDIPTGPGGPLEVWCETAGGDCNFDDFRVHPLKAAMTSYVYNEWGELSHILDNNNLYTEFRYDGMGRLKETYKETFSNGVVRTGEQVYHYAGQD